MKTRILYSIVAIAVGLSAAGCNTIAGMGKDMQRAGEKVEGAAKK